jgi:hypothetical protein
MTVRLGRCFQPQRTMRLYKVVMSINEIEGVLKLSAVL